MNNHAVYKELTAKLVSALNRGFVPWTRPYIRAGMPRNALTGRRYSGINTWITSLAALDANYGSCGWLTFKQAKDLGLMVNKGQKSTHILFMKQIEKDADNHFLMARSYSLFNLDQLIELKPGALDKLRNEIDVGFQHHPVAACEFMVARSGITVKHAHDNPIMPVVPEYRSLDDYVIMPHRDKFLTVERYYATLFHELVHATGHPDRLNRDMGKRFGDFQYGAEELVAELGAAFLAHRFGFDVISYSQSYLGEWLEQINKNPSYLIACASAASKAVDFLFPESVEADEEAA